MNIPPLAVFFNNEDAIYFIVRLIFYVKKIGDLVWVVRKVDIDIQRINNYPLDSAACFVKIYSLD